MKIIAKKCKISLAFCSVIWWQKTDSRGPNKIIPKKHVLYGQQINVVYIIPLVLIDKKNITSARSHEPGPPLKKLGLPAEVIHVAMCKKCAGAGKKRRTLTVWLPSSFHLLKFLIPDSCYLYRLCWGFLKTFLMLF